MEIRSFIVYLFDCFISFENVNVLNLKIIKTENYIMNYAIITYYNIINKNERLRNGKLKNYIYFFKLHF